MDIKKYLLDFYIAQNGEKISPELAKSLVEEFAITDGSDRKTGEKWTMQESKDLGEKYNIDFNTIPLCEWYLVINNMYSDYYQVARNRGVVEPGFFAEMAEAWFIDVDGKENKTFKYFFC